MQKIKALGLVILGFAWSQGSPAQVAAASAPPPAQFDMVGFIQSATLDTTGTICTPAAPELAGGTMIINGIEVVVPCNTILQMPATSLTWADLFDPGASTPLPTGTSPLAGGQSGLALADSVTPFPSYEAHVQGNVVTDPATGVARYIAGLIFLSQQSLNAGTGIINCIDYATGEMRVGGPIGDCASGARVRLNDPAGRFGRVTSPDPRFTADTGNPTVHAATGYPLCVPRADPAVNDDPLCPQANRPLNGDVRFAVDPFLALGTPLHKFDMPPPIPGRFPDATQQAPFEVGDQIDFAGTLVKDANGSYISAHTVVANVAIFTAAGVRPAYVTVEAFLLGTGGTPPSGLTQEATNRIKVEGFTTDPTRSLDIFAIDVNPCTGAETERYLGTADPAAQPVRGRFRFIVEGGLFMPPTREIVVRSRTHTLPDVANGLISGQYRLPNFEFIFAENLVLGDPLLPFNFQDLPFLAQGSGPLSGTGAVVGQLDPWPGSPKPPAPSCTNGGATPVASAGSDITVSSTTRVTLSGSATLDPNGGPPTITWTQTSGPFVPLSGGNTLNPAFTSPNVPPGASSVTLSFRLVVTDAFGSSEPSSVTVTVRPQTDVVTITTLQYRLRRSQLTVNATSNAPGPVQLSVDGFGPMTDLGGGLFTYVQRGVPLPTSITVRSNLGGADTVDQRDPRFVVRAN